MLVILPVFGFLKFISIHRGCVSQTVQNINNCLSTEVGKSLRFPFPSTCTSLIKNFLSSFSQLPVSITCKEEIQKCSQLSVIFCIKWCPTIIILSLSFYFFLTLSRYERYSYWFPKAFTFFSCFRVLLATYDAKSTVSRPNQHLTLLCVRRAPVTSQCAPSKTVVLGKPWLR